MTLGQSGSESRSAWRFMMIALAVFVLLRLPALLLTVTPSSDGAWYVGRALEILHGHGYSEGGIPTAYWPVGYPGFLAGLFALFGPSLLAVKIANLLLGAASLVLIERLGRIVFGGPAGRLAVLLYAVYPNQIAYTALPLTEVLFTFLLLLGIFLFVRRPGPASAFACGLVLGAGTLVKAQTAVFPALLIAVYGWEMRRKIPWPQLLASFIAVYAAAVLVVAPWTVRNYVVFHHFIPVSTNGGTTLYMGNNPNATGDVISDALVPKEFLPNTRRQVEIDQKAQAAALAWITAHPLAFVRLIPIKIWRLWAPDGEGAWGFEAGYAGYARHQTVFRVLRIANQAFYVVCILLCAAALFRQFRQPLPAPNWWSLGPLVIGYTTLISAVFAGESRFHYPVMPWIMIYASGYLLSRITAPARHAARGAGSDASGGLVGGDR